MKVGRPVWKGTKHGGRGKGAKNTRAEQWAALGDVIASQLSDRLADELAKLEGKDYIDAASKILAYFRPRYSATTLELNKGTNTIKAITFESAPKATREDVQRLLREKAEQRFGDIEDAEVVELSTPERQNAKDDELDELAQ